MIRSRTSYVKPQSFFTNRITVLLLLMTVLLMASPAMAAELDLKDTKVSLGGYLKLMMIYDTDGTVDTGPFNGDLVGGYDPALDDTTYADEEDFRMTARESRLFVKTKTNTDSGVLNTHFEGDFFGGSTNSTDTWSNSEAFRLRHAYGSLASGSHVLLAGQTWSNFMDLAAGVPDMDIAGDPGFTFVRQAQVRYQYNLRPGHYLAFSIENPDRGLASAGPVSYFNNAGNSDEKMPDFIAKYFFANKRMTLSPRILLRQFDLSTDESGDEGGTAMAWGVAVSGSVKTGPVRFMATVMYGEGVGRYGGLGNIAGAGLNSDNEVELVGFKSVNAGLTFTLSPTISWNIGAGWAENDDEDYKGSDPILTADATKTAIGYHTNLKWKITPAFEWAIGVGKYQREVMDDREGSMTRFQSYFKYDF